MQWDLEGFEAQNGLRFTWNEWPSTMVEAAKAIVPIAAIYTPMRYIAHIPSAMDYEPARCKQTKCGAVMNPYWCVAQPPPPTLLPPTPPIFFLTLSLSLLRQRLTPPMPNSCVLALRFQRRGLSVQALDVPFLLHAQCHVAVLC